MPRMPYVEVQNLSLKKEWLSDSEAGGGAKYREDTRGRGVSKVETKIREKERKKGKKYESQVGQNCS